MSDDQDDQKDPLEACRETVEELKVENAELRESAESFGALAERLNQVSRIEGDPALGACPRCAKDRYVQGTAPTLRGHDRHCNYCGNSWSSGDQARAAT